MSELSPFTCEQWQPLSPEACGASAGAVRVGAAELAALRDHAPTAPRKRYRFCAHPCADDALHEMLIAHAAGAYVPPHRQRGKSTSGHVIEGEAELLLFDDDGAPVACIALGPAAAGGDFYYRVPAHIYRSLLIRSSVFVFHETTNGPFRVGDTELAPWAPAEADPQAGLRFLLDARHRLTGND